MTKKIGRMTIIVSSLLFLLLVLPQWTTAPDVDPGQVYMTRGNLFAESFKEPVEIIVFIANNGEFYRITNFMSDSVSMVYDEFEDVLAKDELTTRDIIIVIHNHTGPPFKFSITDKRFYTYLKSRGFRGLFLLWSDFHQKVTDRLPREND